MAFYSSVLEEFFGLECTPEFRNRLRAALKDPHPPPFADLGGNLYTLKICYDEGVVLIEDDLDPSEAGKQRVPIQEFSQALDRWHPSERSPG